MPFICGGPLESSRRYAVISGKIDDGAKKKDAREKMARTMNGVNCLLITHLKLTRLFSQYRYGNLFPMLWLLFV